MWMRGHGSSSAPHRTDSHVKIAGLEIAKTGTIRQVCHGERSIDSDVRYPFALIPLLAAGYADAKLFRAPPQPLVTQIGYTTDGLLGESAYRLGCADVLEVAFVDRPEFTVRDFEPPVLGDEDVAGLVDAVDDCSPQLVAVRCGLGQRLYHLKGHFRPHR